MSIVLVCGGRNFHRREYIYETLDDIHRGGAISKLIEGGARGADQIAFEWAVSRGVNWHRYPANWEEHGRKAGILRNLEMLKLGKPTRVLAFPGGRGTEHMIEIATKAGIPVQRFEGPKNDHRHA
jgi:hypothetical protein